MSPECPHLWFTIFTSDGYCTLCRSEDPVTGCPPQGDTDGKPLEVEDHLLAEGLTVKVSAYGDITHRAKGQFSITVAYDADLQLSVLRVRDMDGLTDISVNLPTHKLARLLADAFEAAASDPNSIGHDTWTKEGNLPPRLSHLGGLL